MSAAAEDRYAQASSYDLTARGLHWLTALLVLSEYCVGGAMSAVGRRPPIMLLVQLHLALGSGLLLVVAARILWRMTHRPPPPPPLPKWQKRLAATTHFALYLVLIIMPLAGWASASAHGYPVRAFGILPLPALVRYHSPLGSTLGHVHAHVTYWILLALIAAHVAAALYHRFIERDSVLSRMLPGWMPSRMSQRQSTEIVQTTSLQEAGRRNVASCVISAKRLSTSSAAKTS